MPWPYWLGVNKIVTIYKQKKAVPVDSVDLFFPKSHPASSWLPLPPRKHQRGTATIKINWHQHIGQFVWVIPRGEVGNWKSRAALFHPSAAATSQSRGTDVDYCDEECLRAPDDSVMSCSGHIGPTLT